MNDEKANKQNKQTTTTTWKLNKFEFIKATKISNVAFNIISELLWRQKYSRTP